MWTIELYKEEIDVVRAALGLETIHLLGQSWGGMLAMEYTLTKPKGLASLIVASSPANLEVWVQEANRLREMLPPEVQQTLLKHEAAKTTDTQEYADAVDVFYKRHVCRMDPFPDYVKRTFDNVGQVYLTMNGPSEFHVIGTMKGWNIESRLPEINVPTLLTSGRYDEATPMIMESINKKISGSKWVLFENSAHMAHAEEAELYMKVLDEFLTEVETKQ
jgi:proline-specific peptidase